MRAVTPILAISLLVPLAGVQAQGPPSLAQVITQARQQESEVVRSRVFGVPTVEPNSPAALLWAPGATELRLGGDSRLTPAPTRLSGAAKVSKTVAAIISLPFFALRTGRRWFAVTGGTGARTVVPRFLSGCR